MINLAEELMELKVLADDGMKHFIKYQERFQPIDDIARKKMFDSLNVDSDNKERACLSRKMREQDLVQMYLFFEKIGLLPIRHMENTVKNSDYVFTYSNGKTSYDVFYADFGKMKLYLFLKSNSDYALIYNYSSAEMMYSKYGGGYDLYKHSTYVKKYINGWTNEDLPKGRVSSLGNTHNYKYHEKEMRWEQID